MEGIKPKYRKLNATESEGTFKANVKSEHRRQSQHMNEVRNFEIFPNRNIQKKMDVLLSPYNKTFNLTK